MMNINETYWLALNHRSKYELPCKDRFGGKLSKRENQEYSDLIKRDREYNLTKENHTKIRIHKIRLFTWQYTILIEKNA